MLLLLVYHHYYCLHCHSRMNIKALSSLLVSVVRMSAIYLLFSYFISIEIKNLLQDPPQHGLMMKCPWRQSIWILIQPNTTLFSLERCMNEWRLMKMSRRKWMLQPVIHLVWDIHSQINPQKRPHHLPLHHPKKICVSINDPSMNGITNSLN